MYSGVESLHVVVDTYRRVKMVSPLSHKAEASTMGTSILPFVVFGASSTTTPNDDDSMKWK